MLFLTFKAQLLKHSEPSGVMQERAYPVGVYVFVFFSFPLTSRKEIVH